VDLLGFVRYAKANILELLLLDRAMRLLRRFRNSQSLIFIRLVVPIENAFSFLADVLRLEFDISWLVFMA